jgi:hypothetical protein
MTLTIVLTESVALRASHRISIFQTELDKVVETLFERHHFLSDLYPEILTEQVPFILLYCLS